MTGLKNLSNRMLMLMALGPALLVVAAMFTAIPWLKSLPDPLALTISIGASIAVMVWSLYISTLVNRRQDEVQRASTRYAWQHGATAGSIAVALLLLIPPFGDGVIDTANAAAMALKGTTEKAPLLAFVGGFITLSLAQVIGAFVVCAFWWRSKR